MSEQMDADEFLTWYCWERAVTAAGFYPPEESAENCLEQFEEWDEKDKIAEEATHHRALTECWEFFSSAEARGIDPKARADQYVAKRQEEGVDLPEIDWTWYHETIGDSDE